MRAFQRLIADRRRVGLVAALAWVQRGPSVYFRTTLEFRLHPSSASATTPPIRAKSAG